MPDDRLSSAETPTLGDDVHRSGPAAVPRARPPGWGADMAPDGSAAPGERPPSRLEGAHWAVPEQQPGSVKVLCSVERPGITPVFGTAQPPRGLSGALRGYAFRFSENDLRHWLLLLLADRLNAGEGVVTDLASGRVPNVPAEMGIRAAWKHNPRGVVRKLGLLAGALGLIYMVYRSRRR